MLSLANLSDIVWTSIVAYSMVQGYLLFILFPTNRQGSKQAKWLLATTSLLCALLLTEELLSHAIGYEKLPHLIFSTGPLWYLLSPIIFFYVRHQTARIKVTRKDFWHLLPMVWVLLSSLDFYSFSSETKLYYLKMSAKGSSAPIHTINFILFFSQSVFYLAASWSLIKQEAAYKQRRNEYSWVVQLVIGLGIIAILSLFSILILNVEIKNLWWISSTYFILVSVFLLVLFVQSIRSPNKLYLIRRTTKLKSAHTNAESHESFSELLQFLDDQKPYRNPEFDLPMLSREFGHSRHYLSLLIKEATGLNFRDFINQYRLEEAKKKLASAHSKQFTIQSIASDSGFTSLATFYRAFKKLEGRTPKSFIN